MATANILAVALSEDAIATLSPDILQKLEGLFNSKEDVLTSLKTQLEKLKVNSGMILLMIYSYPVWSTNVISFIIIRPVEMTEVIDKMGGGWG